MRIKCVRKIKGEEMIKEFEKKYDSLENLERYTERNREDYIALMNYEDWKHFLENPEVVVEEGKIIVTDAAFLTVQKLELLEAIKKFEPASVSELVERVGRDFKSVYIDLKELEAAGLRYGIPYGPRARGGTVIAIFVRKALNGESLTIFGDGSQYRNFIYVEDLAEGNVAALKDAAENKTYNLEGMRPITVKEVAETVKKLIGAVEIEYTEERPGDFEGKVVSAGKAKRELDWEPKVEFEEGVHTFFDR